MKPSLNRKLIVSLIAVMLFIMLIVALVVVIFLVRPTPEIDESILIGNYVGKYLVLILITESDKKGIYENSTLSLELKSNGTYVYKRTKIDGAEFTNSGTWEFEYWEDEPIIFFSDFIFALPRRSRTPSIWPVRVERTRGGNIKLGIEKDVGFFFVKQKP